MTFSDHPEKLNHVDYRRMAEGVTCKCHTLLLTA